MTTFEQRATRNNYRGFGAPDAGIWFGRGKTAERFGPVTITRHGRGLTVHTRGGRIVDSFGDTAKFWFIPEGAPGPSADEIAAAAAAEAALQSRLAAAEAERRAAAAELAESYRQTAALLAATPAADPARITWAAAGKPETLIWFDRGIGPGKPLVVTFNEYGNRLYDARTGQEVAHYASDCPQWYAPVPAAPAVEPRTAAPTSVVIVSCGGTKAVGVVAAGAKYVGSYHLMARRAAAALAARTGATVYILSALYGLLQLDTPIDDYDLRMGEPGSVTAGRVAEQAAALGITDAAVTVIAGRAYANVVSTVWPHAVRVLDGTNGMPQQMKRMSEIVRGEWTPAAPAAAAPALFGADLVAPPAADPVPAVQLQRGDVLEPGTFGYDRHADPLLVVASAVSADVVDSRPRVALMVQPATFSGHGWHVLVWADAPVMRTGRRTDVPTGPEQPLPPITDARPIDGPYPTPPPAEISGEYVTLPAGCSLPAYGLLPSNTVIVLARGKFWNSQYRETPDLTMHIAVWGLPTVALCRADLVDTQGREEYADRDGSIYYRHSGRPDLAGRDDARYGYPGESTCETCRREFTQRNREVLPARIRYPMKEERRRIRQQQVRRPWHAASRPQRSPPPFSTQVTPPLCSKPSNRSTWHPSSRPAWANPTSTSRQAERSPPSPRRRPTSRSMRAARSGSGGRHRRKRTGAPASPPGHRRGHRADPFPNAVETRCTTQGDSRCPPLPVPLSNSQVISMQPRRGRWCWYPSLTVIPSAPSCGTTTPATRPCRSSTATAAARPTSPASASSAPLPPNSPPRPTSPPTR